MAATRIPVVFVHGLWLHASSWAPWLDLFDTAGYSSQAPGWPNEPATVEAARAEPDRVANQSIDDIVAHYERIIANLAFTGALKSSGA